VKLSEESRRNLKEISSWSSRRYKQLSEPNVFTKILLFQPPLSVAGCKGNISFSMLFRFEQQKKRLRTFLKEPLRKYPGRDLNPHARFGAKDFKSFVATVSPPGHWSGRRDSNSRPRPWQGRALPTELLPQC